MQPKEKLKEEVRNLDEEKRDKWTILDGLSHCADFMCDGCPYQKYDHYFYKLKCIHKLIDDLNKLLNLEEIQ